MMWWTFDCRSTHISSPAVLTVLRPVFRSTKTVLGGHSITTWMTGLPSKLAWPEPDAGRSSRAAATAAAATTSTIRVSQCRRRARRFASAISGSRDNERRAACADIELLLLAPMLNVKIDRREQTDLFEQVAAEIRRAIAEGEA